ncbi:MAG: exopolysaccharide biosynthesis polyprenyl glycosylphosphotransferase [Ruminococcaceae bacterium]|nr:exopolysaccharide biosynthesis polyprenyl glycosylphosphotransferase [Oscillospiraceae bacterium]
MNNLVKIRKSIMLFVKIMIVSAVTVGFIQVWTTGYAESLFSNKGNYVVILSYVLLFTVFSSLYGAFKIGISRIHEIIYSFSLSIVFTNAIMYLELSLIARELVDIPPILIGIAYQILVVALCSFCANTIYFKLYPPRRVLAVFGDDVSGFELIKKMGKISDRFQIERGINVNTTDISDIKKIIDKYEAVVICGIDKNLQKNILSYCYTHKKRSYLLPDITDIIISNSYNIQISDTPVLMSRNRGLTLEQRIIKRTMDLIISAIAIIITSPIMLICAIAIKLDDGGPILFKQNRITINGKIFNVLKFRSMIVDADKGGAKKAVNDDDRITRVGRVIRACRMDELPQLFNILRGDMSLVGPRPERIENVYEYSKKYPEFELRHRVKGGLTGFAQLYGKYNTSPEDKLHMDLIYVETYSLLLDIKLLILTFKVLFMRESTEGFNEKANENVRASNSLKKESENKK